ncbi:unnamed protein product [Rotaria sp. Silwood2]|nr:unnamed protein product [Rotaria sp. Silwood2]CAF4339350.1 unnamed protein product [Rotaria sp. Silwood2]CAF4373491.1 unnamed protein product [Rotaria sp. Silwood2]
MHLQAFSNLQNLFRGFVPLRAPAIDIHPNAKWIENSLNITGGNQIQYSVSLYVDDDQTIYVVDQVNHRIVEWKYGATSGKVVAGGNGQGNGNNQLNNPLDVIVDKERDSLIICDRENKRVVRWSRAHDGSSGEIVIPNIDCKGLTMDKSRFLYVVDNGTHKVRRFRIDDADTIGTVVAGGNGRGNRIDQLDSPSYVFVDLDDAVYVSDYGNDRVMKWEKSAKEGIIVAGGYGIGNTLKRLAGPQGLVVDQSSTVYVADEYNHRIMRWPKGSPQGSVIVGGNDSEGQSRQINFPVGLSFDRQGNLYVVDLGKREKEGYSWQLINNYIR